ncbi:hypothetical protein A3C39_02870 [Candidatus Saccharibacteria bacterium RIFCSPHIGHO2_02_FULL_46_12]|nr:MAG: hypothetical protein A3C39_02870 [Candidatus Saccharibacteria bacterium RIFCSPHIGHO2_02_FULL_46_12]
MALVFLSKWGMLTVAIVYVATWAIVGLVILIDNRTTTGRNVSRGDDANLRALARKSLVLKMHWRIFPWWSRTGLSIVERDTGDPLSHH